MDPTAVVELLTKFHAARVLVLGDVMLDRFIYGTVDRISPEAPIPVLNIDTFRDAPGGAANVARNIAAMGARATLLGVVGADIAAADLRAQLSDSTAIDARLVADPLRPTTIKTRYVADGQQLMRADRETRAAVSVDVEQRLLEEFVRALEECDLAVLSDYAKGALTDALAREVIAAARRSGKIVIVDPKSDDFAKYAGADIITPNRRELQIACGTDCTSKEGVIAGARHLLERKFCNTIVVTMGKDGMAIIDRDGSAVHLPTRAHQVFDVSGAGDTVVAAMALGLASKGKLIEAAELANVAAGIVVGKQGTATATPEEIFAQIRPYAETGPPQKLYSLDGILSLVEAWRAQGQKIAFTNGCFDLLHPGHVSLLEQARRSADRLIVGLNADLSIRRLKGAGRPIQSEIARATLLGAMSSVDAVVIFAQDTPLDLIEAIEPDVLVKGADYIGKTVVGAEFVTSRGGRVFFAPLLPGHSTTETVKRASWA